MKKLTLQQISPLVRGANYASVNPLCFGPRINYGYQLLYIFDGTGVGHINKRDFDLHPGLVTVYGPGDVHKFQSHSSEGITFATIYFSWEMLGEKYLSMTNRNVPNTNGSYWQLADPKVSINELPEIPFIMNIPFEKRPKLEKLLMETGYSFRNNDDSILQVKYKAVLLEIIYILMRLNTNTSEHVEHDLIRRFKEFIGQHYSEKLKRGNVSSYLRISESYLTALLHKKLNTNFTDYLTEIRMQKAMELLQYSNLIVKEIAEQVGFQDYNYFIIRFRRLHGKPPGAFR